MNHHSSSQGGFKLCNIGETIKFRIIRIPKLDVAKGSVGSVGFHFADSTWTPPQYSSCFCFLINIGVDLFCFSENYTGFTNIRLKLPNRSPRPRETRFLNVPSVPTRRSGRRTWPIWTRPWLGSPWPPGPDPQGDPRSGRTAKGRKWGGQRRWV